MSEAQPSSQAAVNGPSTEEQRTLERRRGRSKRLAWLYGVPSWILFIVATVVMDRSPDAWRPVLLAGAGLGGLAVAAGYFALSRGRSPAWGLLGPAAFLALPLLPDKIARRLDELDVLVNRTPGNRSLRERNDVILWLIVGAVIYPMVKNSLTPAPRPQRQLLRPATGSRPVAPAIPIVENKHFRIKLLSGWSNVTSPTQAAEEVIALARVSNGTALTLFPPISKTSLKGATLTNYATIHQGIRKKDYSEILSASAVIPDTLRGNPVCRYELQRMTKDKLEMRYVVWVWESANYFWAAETYVFFDRLEQNRADMRAIVEEAQAKYE